MGSLYRWKSHYKVVIKDFENSFKNLNNGLLIIDDSSLYLNYDSNLLKKNMV